MAGRVIAAKTRKGSKNTLRKGELSAVERLRKAVKDRGEQDPAVQACLEMLVDIAAGKRRHRHLGDEYRAIVQLLDRTDGKPTERREHSGEVTHTVRIIECEDGEP